MLQKFTLFALLLAQESSVVKPEHPQSLPLPTNVMVQQAVRLIERIIKDFNETNKF